MLDERVRKFYQNHLFTAVYAQGEGHVSESAGNNHLGIVLFVLKQTVIQCTAVNACCEKRTEKRNTDLPAMGMSAKRKMRCGDLRRVQRNYSIGTVRQKNMKFIIFPPAGENRISAGRIISAENLNVSDCTEFIECNIKAAPGKNFFPAFSGYPRFSPFPVAGDGNGGRDGTA